jgi:hypothetical protein
MEQLAEMPEFASSKPTVTDTTCPSAVPYSATVVP